MPPDPPRKSTKAELCFGVLFQERPPKAAYALPASGVRFKAPYSACPSMIGPNNCHFSPVNFIIWTCSIG